MSSDLPSSPNATAARQRQNLLAEAFPSLGIGLLVGTLVSLSLTPVVAGLLTTLGGLLAAMLGLQQEQAADGSETAFSRLRVNGVRIGAFGLACVIGIMGGLYLRTRDAFAVPVKRQIAALEEAGYSRDEAKQFVALQKFGLRPKGQEVVQNDQQKSQMTALFSALKDIDLCDKLSTSQYDNQPERLAAAYRRLSSGAAGDKRAPLYAALAEVADRAERLPADQQLGIFASMETVICAIQRLE